MFLWVFDNDGTLYRDAGASKQFQIIFNRYVSKEFRIHESKVVEMITQLKIKYVTDFSIVAVMKEFGADFQEIVEQTYMQIDLDACGVPRNCLEKRNALQAISGDKIVLTNNPSEYAKRVLDHMGISNCFKGIIGMKEMNFHLKPHVLAFKTVTKRFPDYTEHILIDDNIQNLDTAKTLGWKTVLYCEHELSDEVHHTDAIANSFMIRETKQAAYAEGHWYSYELGYWKPGLLRKL